MNKHRVPAFPMQRSAPAGGFRRKAPALDDRDRVSSHTFSKVDLPRERGTVERHGVTASGVAADLPGALLPFVRVIRPR